MNYIVVTNTRNRPLKLVERSIAASLNQKIKPFKVFLIDQNFTELLLSDSVASNPLFQHLKVSHKSVSSARNSISLSEKVEWIFFCDDDGFAC